MDKPRRVGGHHHRLLDSGAGVEAVKLNTLRQPLQHWIDVQSTRSAGLSPARYVGMPGDNPVDNSNISQAMAWLRSRGDARALDVLTLQVHALFPSYGLSVRCDALGISEGTYNARIQAARKCLATALELWP